MLVRVNTAYNEIALLDISLYSECFKVPATCIEKNVPAFNNVSPNKKPAFHPENFVIATVFCAYWR